MEDSKRPLIRNRVGGDGRNALRSSDQTPNHVDLHSRRTTVRRQRRNTNRRQRREAYDRCRREGYRGLLREIRERFHHLQNLEISLVMRRTRLRFFNCIMERKDIRQDSPSMRNTRSSGETRAPEAVRNFGAAQGSEVGTGNQIRRCNHTHTTGSVAEHGQIPRNVSD